MQVNSPDLEEVHVSGEKQVHLLVLHSHWKIVGELGLHLDPFSTLARHDMETLDNLNPCYQLDFLRPFDSRSRMQICTTS